jgi:oligoendopeptidase F
LEENKKLYGETVRMVDAYQWGWAYIPHFIHTPFYCYAYSFGQLLVLALYDEYKRKGNEFKPGYLALLSSGGKESPADLIVKHTGLDIQQEVFWRKALHLLEGFLDELETLD